MPKRTTKSKRLKVNEVSIPEPIKRMIEARGWHFPPTQEEIRQRLEVLRRFAGALKTDPEIIYAVALETDPTRLGLTVEEVVEWMRKKRKGYNTKMHAAEELKRRVRKIASGGS
ncbi:MAG: hypothetical protein ACK4I8_03760 [Armatimonadota bacterium]